MRIITKLISLCFIATLLAGTVAIAADGYKTIKPVQPTKTGNKIEVLEIFWYGCPHCYGLEPVLTAWKKDLPDDVQFRRMPAALNKNWLAHAKAFFAAEKMGVLEQMHTRMFEALHGERKRIFTRDQIIDFVGDLGIDEDEFSKHYDSNETEIKLREAFIMAQRYKIRGVPTVVVNGKYMTSVTLSGSEQDMLDVIDGLIEMERAQQ
ncbi:MAG: thiol:disulfide interchange protein DsbA/DsbL [Gammaproteobacteria bacterium]